MQILYIYKAMHVASGLTLYLHPHSTPIKGILLAL